MRRIFTKRRRVTRTRILAVAGVLALGLGAAAAVGGWLPYKNEPVRVISGDTIRLGETPVRLAGIDAPDQDQTCRHADGSVYSCGEMATKLMKRLLRNGYPECRDRSVDRYGRRLAVCYADGRDLGRAMVRAGWALTHREGAVTYMSDEASARAQQRGMWAGSFEPPSEWRLKRLQSASSDSGPRSYGFTR